MAIGGVSVVPVGGGSGMTNDQKPTNFICDDISARDALILSPGMKGSIAFVKDATADETVDAGWALYSWDGEAWNKTSEGESLEVAQLLLNYYSKAEIDILLEDVASSDPDPVILPTAGNVTIDASASNKFILSPTAAVTLSNSMFNNLDSKRILIINGANNVSFPAAWNWEEFEPPTLYSNGYTLLELNAVEYNSVVQINAKVVLEYSKIDLDGAVAIWTLDGDGTELINGATASGNGYIFEYDATLEREVLVRETDTDSYTASDMHLPEGGSDRTYCGWYFFPHVNDGYTMWRHGTESTWKKFIALFNQDNNKKFRMDRYAGALTYPNEFTDPGWYHVAWVLENGSLLLYINGVYQGSYGASFDIIGDGECALYFGGQIGVKLADIRVYNKPKSAIEITKIMSEV